MTSSKPPFLDLEQEAWYHLSAAFSAFIKLQATHPSHSSDFANGIHLCQNVLGSRVLQRDYPSMWATYTSDDTKK